MKIITFQKFNLNHALFFGYLIFAFLRKIITTFLFEKTVPTSLYFFFMFNNILCYFVSIIPFLITLYFSKKKTNTTSLNKIVKTYYERKNKLIEVRESKIIFKYIFLVSIFGFLAEAIIFTFHFLNDKPEILSSYDLDSYLIFSSVTQYIVSYFVLKTYFYKHHYLSFIINSVGIIITLTIDTIQIVQKEIISFQYYIYVILRFLRIIVFNFVNSFTKNALCFTFLSPYSLMLYKAIYETVFLLIYSIPFIFIRMSDFYVDDESIFVGFKVYLTGIKLFFSFILFISDFLYSWILILIIDKFSPNHLALANILESLCNTIYSIIKAEHFIWSQYIIFLIYIILFIAAMIHMKYL